MDDEVILDWKWRKDEFFFWIEERRKRERSMT